MKEWWAVKTPVDPSLKGGIWHLYFTNGVKKDQELSNLLDEKHRYYKINWPFLQPKQLWAKVYEELEIPHFCGVVDRVLLRKQYSETRKPEIALIEKPKSNCKPFYHRYLHGKNKSTPTQFLVRKPKQISLGELTGKSLKPPHIGTPESRQPFRQRKSVSFHNDVRIFNISPDPNRKCSLSFGAQGSSVRKNLHDSTSDKTAVNQSQQVQEEVTADSNNLIQNDYSKLSDYQPDSNEPPSTLMVENNYRGADKPVDFSGDFPSALTHKMVNTGEKSLSSENVITDLHPSVVLGENNDTSKKVYVHETLEVNEELYSRNNSASESTIISGDLKQNFKAFSKKRAQGNTFSTESGELDPYVFADSALENSLDKTTIPLCDEAALTKNPSNLQINDMNDQVTFLNNFSLSKTSFKNNEQPKERSITERTQEKNNRTGQPETNRKQKKTQRGRKKGNKTKLFTKKDLYSSQDLDVSISDYDSYSVKPKETDRKSSQQTAADSENEIFNTSYDSNVVGENGVKKNIDSFSEDISSNNLGLNNIGSPPVRESNINTENASEISLTSVDYSDVNQNLPVPHDENAEAWTYKSVFQTQTEKRVENDHIEQSEDRLNSIEITKGLSQITFQSSEVSPDMQYIEKSLTEVNRNLIESTDGSLQVSDVSLCVEHVEESLMEDEGQPMSVSEHSLQATQQSSDASLQMQHIEKPLLDSLSQQEESQVTGEPQINEDGLVIPEPVCLNKQQSSDMSYLREKVNLSSGSSPYENSPKNCEKHQKSCSQQLHSLRCSPKENVPDLPLTTNLNLSSDIGDNINVDSDTPQHEITSEQDLQYLRMSRLAQYRDTGESSLASYCLSNPDVIDNSSCEGEVGFEISEENLSTLNKATCRLTLVDQVLIDNKQEDNVSFNSPGLFSQIINTSGELQKTKSSTISIVVGSGSSSESFGVHEEKLRQTNKSGDPVRASTQVENAILTSSDSSDESFRAKKDISPNNNESFVSVSTSYETDKESGQMILSRHIKKLTLLNKLPEKNKVTDKNLGINERNIESIIEPIPSCHDSSVLNWSIPENNDSYSCNELRIMNRLKSGVTNLSSENNLSSISSKSEESWYEGESWRNSSDKNDEESESFGGQGVVESNEPEIVKEEYPEMNNLGISREIYPSISQKIKEGFSNYFTSSKRIDDNPVSTHQGQHSSGDRVDEEYVEDKSLFLKQWLISSSKTDNNSNEKQEHIEPKSIQYSNIESEKCSREEAHLKAKMSTLAEHEGKSNFQMEPVISCSFSDGELCAQRLCTEILDYTFPPRMGSKSKMERLSHKMFLSCGPNPKEQSSASVIESSDFSDYEPNRVLQLIKPSKKLLNFRADAHKMFNEQCGNADKKEFSHPPVKEKIRKTGIHERTVNPGPDNMQPLYFERLHQTQKAPKQTGECENTNNIPASRKNNFQMESTLSCSFSEGLTNTKKLDTVILNRTFPPLMHSKCPIPKIKKIPLKMLLSHGQKGQSSVSMIGSSDSLKNEPRGVLHLIKPGEKLLNFAGAEYKMINEHCKNTDTNLLHSPAKEENNKTNVPERTANPDPDDMQSLGFEEIHSHTINLLHCTEIEENYIQKINREPSTVLLQKNIEVKPDNEMQGSEHKSTDNSASMLFSSVEQPFTKKKNHEIRRRRAVLLKSLPNKRSSSSEEGVEVSERFSKPWRRPNSKHAIKKETLEENHTTAVSNDLADEGDTQSEVFVNQNSLFSEFRQREKSIETASSEKNKKMLIAKFNKESSSDRDSVRKQEVKNSKKLIITSDKISSDNLNVTNLAKPIETRRKSTVVRKLMAFDEEDDLMEVSELPQSEGIKPVDEKLTRINALEQIPVEKPISMKEALQFDKWFRHQRNAGSTDSHESTHMRCTTNDLPSKMSLQKTDQNFKKSLNNISEVIKQNMRGITFLSPTESFKTKKQAEYDSSKYFHSDHQTASTSLNHSQLDASSFRYSESKSERLPLQEIKGAKANTLRNQAHPNNISVKALWKESCKENCPSLIDKFCSLKNIDSVKPDRKIESKSLKSSVALTDINSAFRYSNKRRLIKEADSPNSKVNLEQVPKKSDTKIFVKNNQNPDLFKSYLKVKDSGLSFAEFYQNYLKNVNATDKSEKEAKSSCSSPPLGIDVSRKRDLSPPLGISNAFRQSFESRTRRDITLETPSQAEPATKKYKKSSTATSLDMLVESCGTHSPEVEILKRRTFFMGQ